MATSRVTASAALPSTPLVSPRRASATPLRRALRSVVGDPPSVLGVALFLLIVAVALFAPTIAPYDPSAVHVRDRLQLPSSQYLFGTDELGRDLLSRIIFGSRISLLVGVIAVGIAATAGILLGLASAFYGGSVD
ncbi:MAG: ABC transporter permease, partial [Chloroflexi bacterium]|nr:ABC transporter permease [Chloroflexota bacterium]